MEKKRKNKPDGLKSLREVGGRSPNYRCGNCGCVRYTDCGCFKADSKSKTSKRDKSKHVAGVKR